MKTKLLSAMMVLGGIMATQAASASDGTITVVGRAISPTCMVNPGGRDFTVVLPTIMTTSFGSAGETGGDTPFSIALTTCGVNGYSVRTYFEPGPAVNAEGRLVPVSGGGQAMNLEFQILNDDHTVIRIGDSATSKPAVIVSGSAVLGYYLRYYATGPVTAGDAVSQVTYSVVYN